MELTEQEISLLWIVIIFGMSLLFASVTYNYLKFCKPKLFKRLVGEDPNLDNDKKVKEDKTLF